MRCQVRNAKGVQCERPARYRFTVESGAGKCVVDVCSYHAAAQRRLLGPIIISEAIISNDERRATSCSGE